MPEGGYSSTQVCSITKVPYGTLFEWMSTGLITPSLVKPQGRGKHAQVGFSRPCSNPHHTRIASA